MFKQLTVLCLPTALVMGCSQAGPADNIRVDAQGPSPITSIENPNSSEADAKAETRSDDSSASSGDAAPANQEPIILGGTTLQCQAQASETLFRCALTNANGKAIAVDGREPSWKFFYDGGKDLVPDAIKVDGGESYDVDLKGNTSGLIRLSITQDMLRFGFEYLIPKKVQE